MVLSYPDEALMKIPTRFLGDFPVTMFQSLVANLTIIFHPMGIASSLLMKVFEAQSYSVYSTNSTPDHIKWSNEGTTQED